MLRFGIAWYQPGDNVFVPVHDRITGGSANISDMQISIGWSENRAVITGPGCPGGIKIVELFQANGFFPPQYAYRWVPLTCASMKPPTELGPLALEDAVPEQDDPTLHAAGHMPPTCPIADAPRSDHVVPTPQLAIQGPPMSKRARVSSAMYGNAASASAAPSSAGAVVCSPLHLCTRSLYPILVRLYV